MWESETTKTLLKKQCPTIATIQFSQVIQPISLCYSNNFEWGTVTNAPRSSSPSTGGMCDIISLGSILIVFNKEVQFNMANGASRLWSCPVVGKGKKSICHDFKFTRNDHSFVQLLHADAYFYVGGNGFGPPKFLEPLVGQLFSINDSFFLVC